MNILMIDSQRVNYIDDGEYARGLEDSPYTLEVTSAATDAQLAWADGIVAFHSVVIDAPLIAKMHRCRALVKATIGLDDVDIGGLSSKRILCSNVGLVGVDEVAEHAMALIMLAQRKILDYALHTRQGGWSWRANTGIVKKCSDSVLGLLGYGATGRAVARRAAVMGYKICYYDPLVDLCSEGIAQRCTLDKLLATADILSLHLPLTSDTQHLLNDQRFSNMKSGVSLVNTARGGIVDTCALLRALESGKLSQAFLDVVQEEPEIPLELASHVRVLLTPHAAFYSNRSLAELKANALKTLVALLEGRPVTTLVNSECLDVEVKAYVEI